MKSFFLTCAVVIALNSNALAYWYEYEYNGLESHPGHVAKCRRFEINRMRKVLCMPRNTLVKLIPQPGYSIYPNYAYVSRCSGLCVESKSCVPVAANLTDVPVQMVGFNTKQCYNVLVEQHTKCRCMCSVRESDCNIYQEYNEDNCSCECMNEEDCDIERQMVWDNKLCKCVCKIREEECTNGLEWVPSRCRCAKIMDMPYNGK